MTPLGLTGEISLSHLLFGQKMSVSPCGIWLDQWLDIFHANTTKKKKKEKKEREESMDKREIAKPIWNQLWPRELCNLALM